MHERRKLTDILRGDDAAKLSSVWNQTAAAGDLGPLPKGEYAALVVSGELFTAKSGTVGYKLCFEVSDGEFTGRKLWHDNWLTPAAMPMTKRDLGKLGITSLEQLNNPLPARFIVKAKVTLRKNDDGDEFNVLKTFDVLGVETPDAFAPQDEGKTYADADLDFNPAKLDEPAVSDPPPSSPAPSTNGLLHGVGPSHLAERR